MSDEIYRPRRKITPQDLENSEMSESLENTPNIPNIPNTPNIPKEPAFKMSGNIPPQMLAALERRQAMTESSPVPVPDPVVNQAVTAPPVMAPKAAPVPRQKTSNVNGSDNFKSLIEKLTAQHQWEAFELPSMAKFYNEIPKVIHIRPMTGEEEQILATPRFVKKGKAIDMIFQRCIRESINTEDLLTIDRNHLLIYLRGISYTCHYDVEMKCPNCSTKFNTVIDLNELEVNECPADFNSNSLEGNLPNSGFYYRYRLSTGRDEQEISNYRDKRLQQFGDQSEDDTLLYRTAMLIEEIEGVTNKKEIMNLLKRLPISDVQHLRNEITDPPFGVDTEIIIDCPSCLENFTTELPLEANFFFPRKKKEETQA